MKSTYSAREIRVRIGALLMLLAIGASMIALSRQFSFCGYICFLRSRPAPYRDAPYFSQEFINELSAYPQPSFSSRGTLTTEDFKGHWLNARSGHRVTAFQPAEATAHSHIYFLGGSTMVSVEVPDEWTIPSLVQRALAPGTRVENFGYSGASIVHQLEKLPDLEIHSGDTVVFYDGFNDLVSFLLGRKTFHALDDETYEAAFVDAYGGATRRVLRTLSETRRRLLGFGVFRDILGDDPTFLLQSFVPPHLRSEEQLRTLRMLLSRNIFDRVSEADRYVKSRGAEFVHVFQPFLGSDGNLSAYEKELHERRGLVPLAMQLALAQGAAVYRDTQEHLEAAGVRSYRLDHVLESRPPGQEVYLDSCHLNHVGNEVVSKRLLELISSGPSRVVPDGGKPRSH